MAFVTGMSVSASMIIALGPQNIFLIKNGLVRDPNTLKIATTYILIDTILILIGAIGVGSLIADAPLLRFFMTIFAAGFFIFIGLQNIRRSNRDIEKPSEVEGGEKDNKFFTAILVSIVNPGVIFDTIVVVGGLASSYDAFQDRMIFSMGAILVSLMWFLSLSAMSVWASRYVDNPNAWRVIERVTGFIMIAVGVMVCYNLYLNELVRPTFG